LPCERADDAVDRNALFDNEEAFSTVSRHDSPRVLAVGARRSSIARISTAAAVLALTFATADPEETVEPP